MSALGVSTLPIGDLSALRAMGLTPVGVVQGVSVGSLNPMRLFHPGRRRRNQGPGFRPGTDDAYFGFLWEKPAEISIMMPVGTRSYSWTLATDRLREAAFDDTVSRPSWGLVNGTGVRGGPEGRGYLARARAIRRWGLELQNAMSIATYPGLVFETGENTASFAHHFDTAHSMMRARALQLGADGIIGVQDSLAPLQDQGASQFKMIGTAVRRIEDQKSTEIPWTTYLDGQALMKLLEAGRMPMEITSSYLYLVAVHTPITEWLRTGQSVASKEITEFQRFRELGYELIRQRIHTSLVGDELHGVTLAQSEHEASRLVASSETWIRGTKVRRFLKDSSAPPPRFTLDLA